MEPKTIHDITWSTFWRALIVAGFAWVFISSFDVLLAILVALVIAAGVDAPISYLKEKGVPRVLSALCIFFFGFLVLAAIVYAIVPLALSDFANVFDNVKKFSGPLIDTFQASDAFQAIVMKIKEWSDSLISGSVPIMQVFASLFGNIFLAITVLILSFYLAVDQDGVEKFIVSILPSSFEESSLDIYFKTRKRISSWIKGQFLLSLIVGILVFIGLWILGVKYSVLLAVLAGIFEIVPFVGPIIAGGLAVLVALSQSLDLFFYTLGLFVAIQQLENNVIVPIVMRYTTNLNPTVIIISILIGGKAFGFVGLILAVPASVFLQEIVDRWTSSKKRRKALSA
ncbi:MAG: AI-2E family transporter [Candidatus Harrisonbacteria bacterium]|nr:AI-2E family transporter [Candidatus Harrisonbacteria bacterium]